MGLTLTVRNEVRRQERMWGCDWRGFSHCQWQCPATTPHHTHHIHTQVLRSTVVL